MTNVTDRVSGHFFQSAGTDKRKEEIKCINFFFFKAWHQIIYVPILIHGPVVGDLWSKVPESEAAGRLLGKKMRRDSTRGGRGAKVFKLVRKIKTSKY